MLRGVNEIVHAAPSMKPTPGGHQDGVWPWVSGSGWQLPTPPCISLLGTTVTDCHRPGVLSNRNSFPHGSGGWRVVKVSAGSASAENGPLGLQMAPSGCVHVALPWCVHRKKESPLESLVTRQKGSESGLHPYNSPLPPPSVSTTLTLGAAASTCEAGRTLTCRR